MYLGCLRGNKQKEIMKIIHNANSQITILIIVFLAFFVPVLEFLKFLLIGKIVALHWSFKNSDQSLFAFVKLYEQVCSYRQLSLHCAITCDCLMYNALMS